MKVSQFQEICEYLKMLKNFYQALYEMGAVDGYKIVELTNLWEDALKLSDEVYREETRFIHIRFENDIKIPKITDET